MVVAELKDAMKETAFHRMDRLRRTGGNWLESLGLLRKEAANKIILDMPGVRLRDYAGSAKTRSVLLVVPAPIKRYYIWDITAGNSVVRHAIAEGFGVYVAEWTEAPADHGVTEYVESLRRCVALIHQRGIQYVHMTTHSLGGILSVAYAALHPADVTSLVLIETPLHFDEKAGTFRPLLAHGVSGHDIARHFGSIPGSFLSTLAAAACPSEFKFERYVDWAASMLNAKDMETHLRVERWTMDELALPGTLYEQVVDQLYRQNLLMHGKFPVSDQHIGPADLRVPLLSVFNPGGRAIPPGSIIPFHMAAKSTEKLLLSYPGEIGVALRHVGALVGRRAHRELWPKIFAWQRSLETKTIPVQGSGLVH
jgi:polyhydroxyalkanoate synthase